MTCVKTGCEAYLEEYRSWVHGDAFRVGDVIIIRVSAMSQWMPFSEDRHLTVHKIAEWFDRDMIHGFGTIVALLDDVDVHPWEGIKEADFAPL